MSNQNRSRSDAFIALIEKHAGILRTVSRAYCRQPAARADLVQEIAAALWRAFPRYDPSRSFSTWMYRIALNVAISFYRAESRRASQTTEIDVIGAVVEAPPADPRVERLLECIDDLNPLDRALVLLHLDGYANGEIADMLGVTSTNAATKLWRVKDRLRRTLTHDAQEKENTYETR